MNEVKDELIRNDNDVKRLISVQRRIINSRKRQLSRSCTSDRIIDIARMRNTKMNIGIAKLRKLK